jgi:hypothetical protein
MFQLPLILLLLASIAQASSDESCSRILANSFARSYEDINVYTHCALGYCGEHIFKFLKGLDAESVKSTRIIVVLPEVSGEILYPKSPRLNESSDGWTYHIVLEQNGIIFDFDYLPASGVETLPDGRKRINPTLDHMKSYFAKMFSNARIQVRVFSGDYFLKEYDPPPPNFRDGGYFAFREDRHGLPIMPLKKFLDQTP